MTLSRRLFLEAASALGITSLAGQTTAETSEDGDVAQQVATKKAPSERFRQGHQLSARRLADTDTYDNEPNITLLNNNQLLLIYRRSPTAGGGHVNNGGYIVARLSNDWGETWTDPVTVADHPEYDTRNQSVIYDRETGIVSVHYRLYDADTGNTEATLFKYSTNHGKSWSDPFPVDLQYVTGRIAAPFGGYARTSNGLMTQWYGFDSDGDYGVVESLFSTDGGRTWGNNVLVGDSTDVSGRVLTEPVPVAYDEDRIWTWGRDNATADMFAIQSEDGGLTWGDPEYFNPTDMTDPTPAWFGMTNDNELTVVWGDRTGNLLRSINASAHLLWQNPSRLENEPVSDVAEQLADNNGDFAYATFTQLGRDRRHTLVTWYDEDVAPNIWLASLANGSGGRVDFDETVPQPPSTTGGTLPAFVQDGFGDGGLTDRSGQIIGTYTDPYQGRAITGAFRPGWNVNGGISVDNQQVLWQEAQAGGDVWMTYPGGAPTVGQWS
ncbi:MAG: sialidase family protein, partial [Halovenus sp.]